MYNSNSTIHTTSKLQKFLKSDFFAPYIFFPFIFFAYFLAGYVFDFGRSDLFYLNKNILPVLIVSFVVYMGAVLLITKTDWAFPRIPIPFISKRIIWVIYVLGLIGLAAFLVMVFTGQIGIADESVRRNLDPKLTFLSSFLWFAVLISFFNNMSHKNLSKKFIIINVAILLIVFILFILSGYRTPLVIMVLTSLLSYHYLYKRIPIVWVLTLFLIMSVALSSFGYMRTVTEDKTKEFNKEVQVELDETDKDVVKEVKKTPEFLLAVTAEFVNGRIVLSRIMEYTDEHGYMNGEIHKSIFSTILPGEQLSPRMHITNMVNEMTKKNGVLVTREGRTTTPTLPGQFFADGGYPLVVVGFAIIGAILALLYNDLKKYGFRSYSGVVYAFVSTIFILSIHTGLLDLLFLIMVGILIFTLLFSVPEKRINY